MAADRAQLASVQALLAEMTSIAEVIAESKYN